MLPLALLFTAIALLSLWGGGVQAPALYAATALLGAAALSTARHTRELRPNRQSGLLIALAGALYAWLLFTTLPLPTEWLTAPGHRGGLVQPVSETLRAAHAAGYTGFNPTARCGLSINRIGSLRMALLLTAMICAAYVTRSLRHERKIMLMRALVVPAVAIAVGGLCSRYLRPADQMWWFLDLRGEPTLGCFINPNHYGVFLAMFCPVVIALATADLRDREWERAALWLLVLMLLLAAIMASRSRGAYIVLAASQVVCVLLVCRRAEVRAGATVTILVCAALLIMSALETPDMARELQTLKEVGLTGRTAIWRQAVRVWGDFPLTGVGAEGFRTVSALYQETPTAIYAHHAESSYLEVLADGGVIGLLLVGALIAACLWYAVLATARKRVRHTELVAAGGALAAAAAHASFDYAVHVPIYGVTCAVFVGLLLPPLARERASASAPEVGTFWRRIWTAVACVPLAWVAVLSLTVGQALTRRDKYPYTAHASVPELLRNLPAAPAYWATWQHLGRQAVADPDPGRSALGLACLARAAQLNPTAPAVWQALAVARQRAGDRTGARQAVRQYRDLIDQAHRP